MNVNLNGVLYTSHLALHYFQQQPPVSERNDRCLILIASTAAYVDDLRGSFYAVTKAGVVGLMRGLRRGGVARVNVVAPG